MNLFPSFRRRPESRFFLLFAIPFFWIPAFAGMTVNNPLPEFAAGKHPVLTSRTTMSRHETVAEWSVGAGVGGRAEVEAKYLGSNLLVGNFGDRVRYLSNEVEAEVRLQFRPLHPRIFLGFAQFLSRYWLDTRDGAGNIRKLTRSFTGVKLMGEASGMPVRPSLILKTMQVLEKNKDTKSVIALGFGARVNLAPLGFSQAEAVGEWNPFLNNPLDYIQAWGVGLRWKVQPRLSLGLFVSNTYGALSADSFFGTRFPQYRFEWSYGF